jgi:ribonucleoside-diphosphate reductase alpha chain
MHYQISPAWTQDYVRLKSSLKCKRKSHQDKLRTHRKLKSDRGRIEIDGVSYVKAKSVEYLSTEKTYNFTVEDVHEYCSTSGIVSKNSGGGTGYSFSRLRPKNSKVQSTQGVASGPLSFMEVFNSATETVKQGGKRRGANMSVLRVDHPDIEEFIAAKRDKTRFTNFNFSVAVTDEFMEAVENGAPFPLVDPNTGEIVRRVDADKLFNQIAEGAWKDGEPGVLFVDAANSGNPTPFLGDYEATNPCGELWLLPYESCNLGSINLANFMTGKDVDWDRLVEIVRLAVRFLDNVIGINKFPIPEIEEMTLKTRKIGLGIMGLHDMLIRKGLAYNSVEGREFAAEVMTFIRGEAVLTSAGLAEEKGAFPAYNGPQTMRYPARRNATLTSIQPTGTVSMIADCSSGCEPYFSVVAVKNVMDGTKLPLVNKQFERIAREEGFYSEELMGKVIESGTVLGHEEIPKKWQEVFRSAQEISPEDHIAMQAALQTNGVDSSISKTVNMPASATVEDVKRAYLQAWKSRCKGVTVYRDGSRDEQVLSTNQAENTVSAEPQLRGHVKLELPVELDAKRYHLTDAEGSSVYIIVGFGERQNPVEVFTAFQYSNRPESREKVTMWTTTCRLVSSMLRHQVPVGEVINQLDKSSGHMNDLPAQLSKLLKRFMAKTEGGFSSPCPECAGTLVYAEGCETCAECGYSKCS